MSDATAAPGRDEGETPRCERCGNSMLLDATGDLWMCHNPLCGAEPPRDGTAGREERLLAALREFKSAALVHDARRLVTARGDIVRVLDESEAARREAEARANGAEDRAFEYAKIIRESSEAHAATSIERDETRAALATAEADAARWRFVLPLLCKQLRARGEMVLVFDERAGDDHAIILPTGSHGDMSDVLVIRAIDAAMNAAARPAGAEGTTP